MSGRRQQTSASVADPSERDARVLELIVEGASCADMARELGYTPGTMRVYLTHMYRRLGVADKTSAAVWHLQREIKKLKRELRAKA